MKGYLRRAQIIAPHQITLGTQMIEHQILRKGQAMIVVSDGFQLVSASISRLKRALNLGIALGHFDFKKRFN